MKSLWTRIEVRWEAVYATLLTALPVLLDQLGVIDLKPLLERFTDHDTAAFLVGLLPFALAFLKPMVSVAPKEPAE